MCLQYTSNFCIFSEIDSHEAINNITWQQECEVDRSHELSYGDKTDVSFEGRLAKKRLPKQEYYYEHSKMTTTFFFVWYGMVSYQTVFWVPCEGNNRDARVGDEIGFIL